VCEEGPEAEETGIEAEEDVVEDSTTTEIGIARGADPKIALGAVIERIENVVIVTQMVIDLPETHVMSGTRAILQTEESLLALDQTGCLTSPLRQLRKIYPRRPSHRLLRLSDQSLLDPRRQVPRSSPSPARHLPPAQEPSPKRDQSRLAIPV
jgi:hypothetical protein